MEMISPHISYKEAIKSQVATNYGIDNIPDKNELNNMILLATQVFEPVRNHFNVPIKIESFYRCHILNNVIGGSLNSQHIFGQAIDIDDDLGGVTNSQLFYYIAQNLEFDQLIWEFGNGTDPGWVHISYVNGKNRNRITLAYYQKTLKKYEHFSSLKDFMFFKDHVYVQ